MSKIVITGASGIIGKLVTQMLIGEGHEITIFSRSPEKTRNILPGAKEYFKWSSEVEEGFEKYIDGRDAVIHLAGASIFGSLWSEEYRNKILSSRENGTRNIVNAIKRVSNKPKTFVSASAIGIYGSSKENQFNEESTAGEGFLADVSKRWEKEASQLCQENIRVVKVRVGIVLDQNDGALDKILLPFKFFMGGNIGSGDQWVSWIHNRDAARVFVEAIMNEKYEGPVNAVSPNPVRMNEFAQILGDILNRPSFLNIPKFPINALLEDAALPVTEGIKVYPQKLKEYRFRFEFEDLKGALINLIND